MYRPYLFCTMMVTIDGKINGGFYELPEYQPAREPYWQDFFTEDNNHHSQAYLSGRTSAELNFCDPAPLDLTPFKDAKVEEGDWWPEGRQDDQIYYFVLSIFGNMHWTANRIPYAMREYTPIEVSTEDVKDDYKAFLQSMGIPYIIAGKGDQLDNKLLLKKLLDYGFKVANLGGGGTINWAWIQEGLCDELSFFIPPIGEGNSTEPSVFSTAGQNIRNPIAFKFRGVEIYDGGILHVKYTCPNSDNGWVDESKKEEVKIVSAKPMDSK